MPCENTMTYPLNHEKKTVSDFMTIVMNFFTKNDGCYVTLDMILSAGCVVPWGPFIPTLQPSCSICITTTIRLSKFSVPWNIFISKDSRWCQQIVSSDLRPARVTYCI